MTSVSSYDNSDWEKRRLAEEKGDCDQVSSVGKGMCEALSGGSMNIKCWLYPGCREMEPHEKTWKIMQDSKSVAIDDLATVVMFYAAWGLFFIHMTYPNYPLCVDPGTGGYGQYEYMEPQTLQDNAVLNALDKVQENLPSGDEIIDMFTWKGHALTRRDCVKAHAYCSQKQMHCDMSAHCDTMFGAAELVEEAKDFTEFVEDELLESLESSEHAPGIPSPSNSILCDTPDEGCV